MTGQWRYAASLIVAARRNDGGIAVAMVRRSDRNRHLPGSNVFPGGLVDSSIDFSSSWWPLLRSTGMPLDDLVSLQAERPATFTEYHPNTESSEKQAEPSLPPELGFRMTALRETFEETGLLFVRPCASRASSDASRAALQILPRSLADQWRRRVQHNAAQLLVMANQLSLVPDVWSLFEWSCWLTPAHLEKRHDTAFFITCMPQVCHDMPLQPDLTETATAKWVKAKDVLSDHFTGHSRLMPPQLYELGRLASFSNWHKLCSFSYDRRHRGMTRMLPVLLRLADGRIVGTLPGDDLYPEHPTHETRVGHVQTLPFSYEQATVNTKRFHRIEDMKTFRCNCQLPNGHIPPVFEDQVSKL